MDNSNINELMLVRNLYCVVLSHYLYSVKGGWQQLEETVNFLVLNYGKVFKLRLLYNQHSYFISLFFHKPMQAFFFLLP